MLRRLFNLLAALSLLLLAAIAVLDVRQSMPGRPEAELFSVRPPALRARYTLRADAGGLWLFRPPYGRALRPPRVSEPVAKLVAKLDNDQIEWPLYQDDSTGQFFVNFQGPKDGQGLYTALVAQKEAEVVPALLDALEDPARFVAAHYYLMAVTGDAPEGVDTYDVTPLPDGWMCHNEHGLRVELSPIEGIRSGLMVVRPVTRYSTNVRIRPEQLPRLRAGWHRLLDEPAAAPGYAACAAATGLMPLSWIAARGWRTARRRRRARGGLCRACGYDLRATPGKCPECGAGAAGAL